MIESALLSGVTAVMFGFVYQVAGRTLAIAGFIGALSWALSLVVGKIPGAGSLGDLIGALVVGGMAELAAYWRREPVSIFVVPAIIVFVPGEMVYQSMESFLKGHFLAGLQTGLTALLSAGAIAVGLALATALVRPLVRHILQHAA